jgi:hypothetical protein
MTWTKDDSHATFLEAQALLKEATQEAENDLWTANCIINLIKDYSGYLKQDGE